MAPNYISRTLIVNRGLGDERTVTEDDFSAIDAPIIILGDPGLGKTELTKELEKRFGFKRVAGGTFYRNQNTARYATALNSKLVIDGLDEITSSSGVSAIDEVLKKLSEIGNPNFVLSCRSADWQGSTDRYKIAEDYGAEPVTLHLQPFSYQDATTFLSSYDGSINADQVLDQLDKYDLSEFYTNPLTLTLVAEIVTAGQGLPKGRADLFDSASKLLTSEQNPIHQRSSAAQSNLDALLDSAGAVFSHLLLSGSIGLTDRPRDQIPEGYVHIGELAHIADAPLILEAIKTRLFQSPDENLYTPFHRVIAEYLGARWLSKRLSNGLSERRVFQALTFNGGVPTAFRGLHAWLAHFSPRFAPRCIRSDPYGVLRYGEPNRLPLDQARLLLSSLTSLADEDPYFRSEDWGRRAVSGLARRELKDEIVALIKSPDRHVHLSTLILEALGESTLTKTIAQELLAIVENSTAAYVERSHAAEALIRGAVDINWPAVAERLRTRSETGDNRLTLEIIALTCGEGFSGVQIADAILAYKKPSRQTATEDESDDEPYVSGMVWGIQRRVSPRKSREILDGIVSRIKDQRKPAHWRPGYELANSVHELIERAVEHNHVPSPEQAWSWLKLTEADRGHSSKSGDRIHSWLTQNPNLRREIQKVAFGNASNDGGPWMAIVHDLPSTNRTLALSTTDVVELLIEVGAKDSLGNFDVELWTALIQSQRNTDGVSQEIQTAADVGIHRHSVLKQQWSRIMSPPTRDWRREEEQRRQDHEKKRARKFAKHRASFLPAKDRIASGEELGALKQIANAYLGRYYDLNEEASPDGRVREWLGNELASAALEGFVRALSRNDIPTAEQIAETRAEGKEWNVEAILISGIAELVRSGRPLNAISRPVLLSSLAAWWEFPEFNSSRLGEQIQEQLEDLVLSSEQDTEAFLRSVAEPRVRAGHQHIPALYRLAHDTRFKPITGRTALLWLRAYPNAHSSVQLELLHIAVEFAPPNELQALVRERLSNLENAEDVQLAWMSAAFVSDFRNSQEALTKFFNSNKDYLWSLREMVRPERRERRAPRTISIQQLEFIILAFANKWPPAVHPSSSWGDTNPWNAAEFISACISAIAADSSNEASASLERISSASVAEAYSDQIHHARSQQLRLRRDTEFCAPKFEQIRGTLAGQLPGNIDDLKAVILDQLEIVQDYIRNGNTNAWEAFWNEDRPKDENTCRDRLLDQLRAHVPVDINFLPEITMPENNRADIVAIYRGYGVPIEIKGQWNSNVWHAASVQLIEQYARDWRADDRGIYLVLWFGNVPKKNLVNHPDGLPRPSSPDELREMLLNRLSSTERARIDVFVLDVSKPRPRA